MNIMQHMHMLCICFAHGMSMHTRYAHAMHTPCRTAVVSSVIVLWLGAPPSLLTYNLLSMRAT